MFVNGVCGNYISSIPESFYTLQLSEREAKATENNAYNYILSISLNNNKATNFSNYKMVYNSMDTIFDCLGIKSIDERELFSKYDKAKLCIIKQELPEESDDITATLLYYLANILKFETMENISGVEFRENFNDSLNPKNAKNILINYYKSEGKSFLFRDYDNRVQGIAFSNDLFDDNHVYWAENLAEISKEDQRRNPEMIMMAILCDSEKIKRELSEIKEGRLNKDEKDLYIKDLDSFRIWYYSHLNTYGEKSMEIISDVIDGGFGFNPPKFSYETYLKNRQCAPKELGRKLIDKDNLNKTFDSEAITVGKAWEPIKKEPVVKLTKDKAGDNDINLNHM